MAKLPREFLQWNYFARRELLLKLSSGGFEDPKLLFIEFTRHNPVLCTAAVGEGGDVEVNGKVIGVGYVLKPEYIPEAARRLEEHLKATDEAVAAGLRNQKEIVKEHAARGLRLLLDLVYLEPEAAEERVDFEKLASVELALRIPHSSKHTWSILQRSRKACLVFYQPPSISYEVRCSVSVDEGGAYHRFVNLIHDAYHYTPPEKRGGRPVYLFHVEEVYDNSASPQGFGRRLV